MIPDTNFGQGYRFWVGVQWASTTAGYPYMPWELKHVTGIQQSITGNTITIGIPNKPATRTQIFDTMGPMRTIKISGVRNDHEEDISNYDFINTQNNYVTYNGRTRVQVGIAWLLSTMQVNKKGYLYEVEELDSSLNLYPGERANVAITAFSSSYDPDKPHLLNYTISLVERRSVGTTLYSQYTGV